MVSAVRKEEVQYVPPVRKQNRIKHKPDDRTDAILRIRGRLATGLVLSVTILLMFATVGRYAELSDKQIQIDRMQKAIEEEQSRAQQLSLCVAQGQDIGAIEEYARTSGMEYGDRASVTYVDLPEERPPTQYAEVPEEGEGLLAMLAQLLD